MECIHENLRVLQVKLATESNLKLTKGNRRLKTLKCLEISFVPVVVLLFLLFFLTGWGLATSSLVFLARRERFPSVFDHSTRAARSSGARGANLRRIQMRFISLLHRATCGCAYLCVRVLEVGEKEGPSRRAHGQYHISSRM